MLSVLIWFGMAWGGGQVLVAGDEVTFASDADAAVQAAVEAYESGAYADASRQLTALVQAGGDEAVWTLHVAALYEAGRLRAAERAAAEARAAFPDDVPLSVLGAIVLADLGRGDEARGPLEEARRRASGAWLVRAWLAEATLHEDGGDLAAADRALDAASRAMPRGTDWAQLADVVARRKAALAQHQAVDRVGRVSDALGAGRLDAASQVAEAGSDDTVREAVRRDIGRAMVARARGDMTGAITHGRAALRAADDAGLLRESVLGRLELARALAGAGRREEAAARLADAESLVSGTSLTVRAAEVLVARVLLAARDRQGEAATGALARLEALDVDQMPEAVGRRAEEARAAVAALGGDPEAAATRLTAVARSWRSAGRPAEAARVQLERVRVRAAMPAEPRKDTLDREVRETLVAAGLRAPEAEVLAATALGRADAGDLVGAIAWLEEARDMATADPSLRGRIDGWIDEAAQRLGVTGPDGGERVVQIDEGIRAYQAGRVAFESGDTAAAAEAFGRAVALLDRAGDTDRAAQARQAWLLARWNVAMGDPATPSSVHTAIAAEASSAGLSELEARAGASAALAADREGTVDPQRLGAAADAAHRAGLLGLARACLAARARRAPVEGAVEAARQLDRWKEGAAATTALVDAAFVAWRQGDRATVSTLVDEVVQRTGEAAPTGPTASDLTVLQEALAAEAIDPAASVD